MRSGKILIGAVVLIMTAPFVFAQLRVPALPERSNLIIEPGSRTGGTFLNDRKQNDLPLISRYDEIASYCAPAQDSQSGKFKMTKSPTVAVLLSAVLPGAGQIYNGSYWKAPIFAGLIGYFVYEYIDNNNQFIDYRDQYKASITPEDPNGNPNLKALREFYRDQRNDFVWYIMIVYVVNLVDAYVDAHLFDFDVREDKLTRAGKTDRELKLRVNYNF